MEMWLGTTVVVALLWFKPTRTLLWWTVLLPVALLLLWLHLSEPELGD